MHVPARHLKKQQTDQPPPVHAAQARGCEQGEPPLHGNRGQKSPCFWDLDSFMKSVTSYLFKVLAPQNSARDTHTLPSLAGTKSQFKPLCTPRSSTQPPPSFPLRQMLPTEAHPISKTNRYTGQGRQRSPLLSAHTPLPHCSQAQALMPPLEPLLMPPEADQSLQVSCMWGLNEPKTCCKASGAAAKQGQQIPNQTARPWGAPPAQEPPKSPMWYQIKPPSPWLCHARDTQPR